jgi:uncharacterized damage-inducible protein DinB
MTTSLLRDAFRHHAWANDRLFETCRTLTPEQLAAPSPGTFGPILDTLRHLVGSDRWYLWVITEGGVERLDEEHLGIDGLQAAAKVSAAAWEELLAGELDGDTDIARVEDDWEFHAPLGLRLAQAVHHGTDHRSQVCTALTSLGIEPPGIDLWEYGEATGRTRAVGQIPD